MEHTNYIPKRGEQILVSDIRTGFVTDPKTRVFSHIENDRFYCYNDSYSLTDTLSENLNSWRNCKRLKGEFHVDFKPTNVLLNYNQY